MESMQSSKSCVQCKTGNPIAAKFCGECGERFVVSACDLISTTRLNASARTSGDPHTALEQLMLSLDNEKATSRLHTAIAGNRAQLKTLGVPLPKATNPLLVSLMESLKALPRTEISARIAIVTALGRMGDAAVLPPLLLVTGAQSKDVRKATAVALGCIRHPLSAYLLLPMLQDGSSRVKQAAFQALIQLNQPYTIEAILAACLGSKSLRSLILETLRLVSANKRDAFFALTSAANAELQPELKIVADWLRFEFRNVRTASNHFQNQYVPAVQQKPVIETPALRKPASELNAIPENARSSQSDMFGLERTEETQSNRASGVASAYRYNSRGAGVAIAAPPRTPDRYELAWDFAEDDESDVRLVDDSNRSEIDLTFFDTMAEPLLEMPEDDEYSELESASNGSQALMSVSGLLAAPDMAGPSSVQTTRSKDQHAAGNRPPESGGLTTQGSPKVAVTLLPWSANDNAPVMGNTHGLSAPMMQPGLITSPASEMTTSSPLIPAFTSGILQPASVTATTHVAWQAAFEASSTAQQLSPVRPVTKAAPTAEDEQSAEEIAAEKASAAAAHEKALARLSAAREEAFRRLLEDAEKIPKTLPRHLKKRVSALMATPSTKMDRVIEQLHELGAANSPAALSTLASFCHKPAKQIREACAEAIGCIAHPGSAVLLLKLLADKSGTVVEAALKALTKLDLEPARPVLLAAGLCGTSLRTVVTVGVESTSDDKKSEWQKLLLEVLRSDDTNSAAFAVSLLARIAGDTHVEIFQSLASHKNPVLRAAAVEALARTQAKRAISQINDALADADPVVRAQAAMSVATMYSPRSVELLRKLVFDSNLTVRRNAAQSMSRIDESDLADVIATALDQETDATTVEYLLAALQRNGADSSLLILQHYIEGESSQFREQAVKALRKLKIPASVPVFRRLLDDHSPGLRRQSIEQLAVLKAEGVLPRLREMLKQDPDETVRSACAKALGDFGDESSVHLLEEALEDHALVRLQAVIALGRLGQTSAGPTLLSLLRDQLPEVRYQAVRGIGLLKLDDAVEHVQPLLDDADELVRRGAEQTLTDLGITTGNRKARQWQRRLSIAAGWIAPSTIAGLVPGGAKTLFAVVLLIASSVGMFAFKGILMAASGQQFDIEAPVSMSVSSNGENILVVRQFGVSEVWNLESGKLACRQSLPGRVTGGIFVNDSSLLINQDGKMVAYDFLDMTLKEAGPTLSLPEQITHTVLHRQTKTLFVAYLKENSSHLASYNLETMKLQSDKPLSKIPGSQMTVSPDGNVVASMSGATVLIFDLKNDQVGEFSFSDLTGGANGGEVLAMSFSDDMKFLAISQSSFGVAVIEMATTRVKAKLAPKDSFGYAFVQFATGTHNLVAVSAGGKVIVSSKEFASTEDFNIDGCRSAIDMFSVSEDNQHVAVASTEELDVFIGDAVANQFSHQLVAVDDE